METLLFSSSFETRSGLELMILLPHCLPRAGIISHLAELDFHKVQEAGTSLRGGTAGWGWGHGRVRTSLCGHQGSLTVTAATVLDLCVISVEGTVGVSWTRQSLDLAGNFQNTKLGCNFIPTADV